MFDNESYLQIFYSMKASFTLFSFLFVFLLISSCGGNQQVDYSEVIVGEWRLKNAGELQRYLPAERGYLLKNAAIVFHEDGTVEAQLMKSQNQEWFTQKGTWEIAEDGTTITIDADGVAFDDELPISFPNERAFYLTSNQLIYHFVKL